MAKEQARKYENGMAVSGIITKGHNFIHTLRMFAHVGSNFPTSLHTSYDNVRTSRNAKANAERLSSYSLAEMRRHNTS